MANSTAGNPKTFDTAGATSAITKPFRCQLIQWIDDAADIADDDDLVFVVNGATVTQKVQLTANAVANTVLYEASFPLGILINSFSITTIDHGLLVLWTV